MRIRTIALDVGMVVLNFSHELACCRLSRLGGGKIAASALFQRLFGSGLNAAMDLGMPLEEIARQLREAAELTAPDEEIVRAFSDIFWVNSDVCDALPFIPREFRVLIASNTNEAHAGFFRREFAPVLGGLDAQVLSCEVSASKPSREFYEHVIRAAGCGPGEILFFDDREENIQGAAACGLTTVHYCSGASFRDSLAAYGVTPAPQPTR